MSCNSDSSSQASGSPDELKVTPHLKDPPAAGFQLLEDEKELEEFVDKVSPYYVPLPSNRIRDDAERAELLREEILIKHQSNVEKYNELSDEGKEEWKNKAGYGVVWGNVKKYFAATFNGMKVDSDDYKLVEGRCKRKAQAEKTSVQRKIMKGAKNRVRQQQYPYLLKTETYKCLESIAEENIREHYRQMLRTDDDLEHGVLIVDGLNGVRLHTFEQLVEATSEGTWELLETVKGLQKGGILVTFDSKDGIAVKSGLMMLNQLGEEDIKKYGITNIPQWGWSCLR